MSDQPTNQQGQTNPNLQVVPIQAPPTPQQPGANIHPGYPGPQPTPYQQPQQLQQPTQPPAPQPTPHYSQQPVYQQPVQPQLPPAPQQQPQYVDPRYYAQPEPQQPVYQQQQQPQYQQPQQPVYQQQQQPQYQQPVQPQQAPQNYQYAPNQPQQLAGAFEALQGQQQQAVQQQQNVDALTAEILFEKEFDGVINDNKELFKFDAVKMREPAKELTGQQLNHTLKCTAVKDFFSDQNNLGVLHEQDQNYIRENVLNKHDNNIDSNFSWNILMNALHISKRIKQQLAFKNAGATMSSTDTPNTDAFFQRVRDRGAGIKPQPKAAKGA